MGIISFLKNAGTKLFGGKTDAEKAAEAAAAEQAANDLADSQKEQELIAEVNNWSMKVDNLGITVDGDRATIRGQAYDQATREKTVLICGNVAGIQYVDDQLTVTHSAPEAQYYQVQKGDTLSKIAKAYYNNSNKYNEIFEANKPMLDHPDKIYPGQVLRIPALEA